MQLSNDRRSHAEMPVLQNRPAAGKQKVEKGTYLHPKVIQEQSDVWGDYFQKEFVK